MKKLMLTATICSLAACCGCQKSEDTSSAKTQSQAPELQKEDLRSYKGKILEIYTVVGPDGQTSDLGILMRTDKGEIPVHLGPSSFIQSGPVRLEPNHEIEVEGYERYDNGQIFVIAKEIKLKDYKLKLRDQEGVPLWSGWKKM